LKDRPEELFSETMTDLTDFDGFPSDSSVIGLPARNKKPRLQGKPTYPTETSSTNSPQTTAQADKPTQATCLLMRRDKKITTLQLFCPHLHELASAAANLTRQPSSQCQRQLKDW
jgi:hypothetical protein